MKRRKLKKVITLSLFRGRLLKRSSVFRGKGVTPSVAAPGDTNLSDATDYSRTSEARWAMSYLNLH